MQELLWVGTGGFAGAVLRFLVGKAAADWNARLGLPVATLAVKTTGRLVMGLLSCVAQTRNVFSSKTRSFLLVGMLGAFTTFLALANETSMLLRQGQLWQAGLNVAIHLVLGLVSIQAGRAISKLCTQERGKWA